MITYLAYTEELAIWAPDPVLPVDSTDNSFLNDCFLFQSYKLNYY